MSFKTILVHVGADAGSDARVRLAAHLAQAEGGRVVGVGAVLFEPFVDPISGFVDPRTVQALRDQVDADLAKAQAGFLKATGKVGVDATWRAALEVPGRALARQACAADLVVAGPSRGQSSEVYAHADDLVMDAGIPVLAAPVPCTELPAATILVAWKNTREARRALADALPFLRRARRVVVAAIAEHPDQALEAELEDVAERLRLHGVTADPHPSPWVALDPGVQILALAESQQADLIVAGAYGHSRAREWAFGGVTRTLLTTAERPVLFSR